MNFSTKKDSSTPPKFSCHLCGKTYKQVGYLKRHEKTHITGVETVRNSVPKLLTPSKCEVCGKFYATAKGLTDHMKVHEQNAFSNSSHSSKSFFKPIYELFKQPGESLLNSVGENLSDQDSIANSSQQDKMMVLDRSTHAQQMETEVSSAKSMTNEPNRGKIEGKTRGRPRTRDLALTKSVSKTVYVNRHPKARNDEGNQGDSGMVNVENPVEKSCPGQTNQRHKKTDITGLAIADQNPSNSGLFTIHNTTVTVRENLSESATGSTGKIISGIAVGRTLLENSRPIIDKSLPNNLGDSTGSSNLVIDEVVMVSSEQSGQCTLAQSVSGKNTKLKPCTVIIERFDNMTFNSAQFEKILPTLDQNAECSEPLVSSAGGKKQLAKKLSKQKRQKSLNNPSRPVKCGECGRYFTSQKTLDVHLAEHAKESRLLTIEVQEYASLCDNDTGADPSTMANEEGHTSTKNKNAVSTFSISDVNSKVSKPRKRHSKKSQDGRSLCNKTGQRKIFQCSICSKILSSARGLACHVKVHERKRLKKENKCEICGKKFILPCRLRNHMTFHGADFPFPCEDCGLKFPLYSLLKNHRKVHVKPFQCEQCGKKHSRASYLKDHMKIHTGGTPYKCEVCDSFYLSQYSLNRHMKSHDSIHTFNFSCDTCGKSFEYKSKLRRHQTSHASERPHSCEICGRKFKCKRTLDLHKGCCNVPKGEYECLKCGRKFGRKPSLTVHMKIHSQPQCCLMCPKKFTRKWHLDYHIKAVHKPRESKSRCPECGVSVGVSKYAEHMRDHLMEIMSNVPHFF